jgi:hypothetical protein
MFGELSGILNQETFSSCAVNFMLDFLRRLFISTMIDESLKYADCAVTLEQAKAAIHANFAAYHTAVPDALINEVTEMAEETTVSSGHSRQTTAAPGLADDEVVMQVAIDPLWRALCTHWTEASKETDASLLGVFDSFDSNHDVRPPCIITTVCSQGKSTPGQCGLTWGGLLHAGGSQPGRVRSHREGGGEEQGADPDRGRR